MKIAVMASGSGSNFQAILDEGIKVDLLISNQKQAYAIQRAQANGVPTHLLKKTESLLEVLTRYQIDLVVLAGYLKQIEMDVIKAYPKRIINIHPSLLPKYGGKGFYGIKVHQAVLQAQESESGATVHYVDEQLDTGPIILQEKCSVYHTDTPESLQQRVLQIEHRLLPLAIKKIVEGENQ